MASRWLPDGPIRVRPKTGWVFLACTMIVTGPVFVAAFMPVRPTTPAIATLALSATAVAYIYFVAPRIVVAEEAIRVQNSWREHVVPWGALVDIETRFNLTLVTPEGRVHVQAAPSPGGLTAMRSRPDRDRATTRATGHAGGAARPGDLPSSLSGALAAVIRGHWQDLVETGAIGTDYRVQTAARVTHLALSIGGPALALVLWLLA